VLLYFVCVLIDASGDDDRMLGSDVTKQMANVWCVCLHAVAPYVSTTTLLLSVRVGGCKGRCTWIVEIMYDDRLANVICASCDRAMRLMCKEDCDV
jgi:hypothetical protein